MTTTTTEHGDHTERDNAYRALCRARDAYEQAREQDPSSSATQRAFADYDRRSGIFIDAVEADPYTV